MVRPLDKIIEAEREIMEIESKYQKYAAAIRNALEYIKNLDDEESIQLFKYLMNTMESIPTLIIEFKSDILDIIGSVAAEAETLKIKALIYENHKYKDLREKFIQNFRRGLKELTKKEGLLKLNNLYYLILYGKIPLQDLDKYLEKIRDRAPDLDQETQIKYARQEAAREYLGVIIKGLLIDPIKYEPLYKQLIKTGNLKEFFEYLQEEYENLIPKKT
jgi:uncharacterized short protein YbdD (DUF466 family)